MTNKNERDTTANDWFKQWNQSMSEMMAGMLRVWYPESRFQGKGPDGGPAAETETGRRVRASVDAALKNWQAVSAAMTAPESMEALFKGVGGMPETLAQLAKTSLNSFLEMQTKTVERMGKMGEHVDAYTFADMEESLFRTWTEMYETEFSRYFQIPKLGLVREYQERVSRSLDAYNRYQAALGEFLRLLAMPVSRSFTVLQDQLASMAEEGQLPEDGRAYYELWVKVLEGHYMTLFQTPEYVEAFSKTLTSNATFQNARNAVIEDMLAGLPVPTRTEIDALYEELHRLKRRLRTLEKDKG